MRDHRNANEFIQQGVAVCDFLLTNMLILLFLYTPGLHIADTLKGSSKVFILTANFAFIIAEYFFHTIIHIRKLRIGDIAKRVVGLAATQAAVSFFVMRAMGDFGGMFWSFIVYSISLYVVLMISRIIEHSILKYYRSHGRNTRSVVLVGNDPANVTVYKELVDDPATGYKVLGYYSNGTIKDGPKELKKLGDIDHDLYARIIDKDSDSKLCNDIFCSMSHNEYEKIIRIMQYCDRSGIHFFYVPRQFGNYLLQLKTERIGNVEVMTNHEEPLLDPTNKFIKRSFDTSSSIVACICMLPFIPIIALIIKVQSPGPIFFKQKRTGLNGETFDCYKFRSMHVNKNADLEQATKNDPRKFPFGNFMRKTNIDELPQFFNVLKGDMSIVGPRPHMLHHTDIYSKLIGKYMVRHFSKPGITGWAQVTGYRGETKELWQMEERVRRDIWYIENWSFWLDIKIIFMTIKDVFVHDEHAY